MAAVVKIPYFLATRHAKSVSFSARGNYTKILQRTSGRLAYDNALRRIFDKPAQGGLRDGAGRRSPACRRQGPWRERDRSSPVRSWPASDSGSADHPSADCARRQSLQGSFQRQEHHPAREAPSPQTSLFEARLARRIAHFWWCVRLHSPSHMLLEDPTSAQESLPDASPRHSAISKSP